MFLISGILYPLSARPRGPPPFHVGAVPAARAPRFVIGRVQRPHRFSDSQVKSGAWRGGGASCGLEAATGSFTPLCSLLEICFFQADTSLLTPSLGFILH